MTDALANPESIDSLIAQRVPGWLVDHANPDRLPALRRALRRQAHNTRSLERVLGAIPPLDTFVADLLDDALRRAGIAHPDVRQSKVRVSQRLVLPTGSPVLPQPMFVRRSKRSLLEAALHNFHRSETRPAPHRRGDLIDRNGRRLPLGLEAFAGVCREVDAGRRYQEALKEHFEPSSASGEAQGDATARLNTLIQECFRNNFEVAVRIAALKRDLDERAFLLMLPIMAEQPVVPALEASVVPRQLYLMGRRIFGVLTLEVRPAPDQPVEAVILWIPDDPQTPVSCHASWAALNRWLGLRFLDPAYRRFFARFIAERDRINFYRVLAARVDQAPVAGVELDARDAPIAMPIFEYLRKQYVDKRIDDAMVLAVPTGVEDEADRNARLQGYLELGLNVLNLAGFFVPGLGEVMLVANVLQIADEVYEGYQDWRIGDREGAMDHLFNVAENVVIGALIAKGSQLGQRALERVAFVDGLVPVQASAGHTRLMAADLPGYHAQPRPGSGGSEWVWRVNERHYRVIDEPKEGASRIQHPGRSNAYQPLIEANGSGGWRHELEAPQLWSGRANLVRRFSARLSELPDATCEYLLQVTGLSEAQLRRLHLENVEAPARLLDALELKHVHDLHPDLSAPAVAQRVAARQTQPNASERLLQRAFPGLSTRATQEVLQQSTGAQLDMMGELRRIPLAVAERARWMLRESRLDKACAGLQLPRCVSPDTERLALGLLERLNTWPDSLRVELRETSPNGRVLASAGRDGAGHVRCILRSGSEYRVVEPPLSGTFMQALLATLSDEQKSALGDAIVTPAALGERLAEAASQNRTQAAELCAMVRLGEGLRPPRRFGDGRLGYTLSGGQGSTRRAIARGIHQIFPTLEEGELDAYLLDLMSRRVGLWAHYSELRDQLAGLRASLRQWRRDTGNPLEAMRRRRVATALRRSWRRKITDLGGDYVLVIDGERVGSLPDLPPGVRYDHVRRLVLRDLGLQEISSDFLQRFPNLVELDLSGNRLTTIPQGIEQMQRLRRLHLQGNRVVLDAPGELRLTRLDSLQQLDLSHNPLGRAPVLTRLAHLREVNLRWVGLSEVPDRVSFRATVDLRNNRIRELRQELRQLRLQIGQMSLHDNPLGEADEALLDEARGVTAGQRGSSSVRHQPFTDELFDTWAGMATGTERDRLLDTWQDLRQEPQSIGLFRFLADFASADDFERHPGHYRTRIWRIMEACRHHEQLRQRLFLEASGPRTCEDRMLFLLEQLELGVTVERALEDALPAQREARLLRLARGLYRLDEVDRLAALHIQRMHAEQLVLVDEIEVRLFYRLRLSRALGLPVESDDMHYPGFANVTPRDLLRVQDQVLEAENADTLIASLSQRPFWEQHAREAYAQRFEEALQPLQARLDSLQAQADENVIDEWQYLQRCQALKADYEQAERALIARLAREASQRWLHNNR
ncbi:NEL-type E3 ubiquitin ligase domain-containing protein [Pseudomonas sp. NPDC008258]|uniref:NEL-type E3 ubiquitin ligase domain-containing protein n=1 Tax=Pseudomonas sp. NPDC008258 TaxID=3364418 RepID=UPI0036F01A4D